MVRLLDLIDDGLEVLVFAVGLSCDFLSSLVSLWLVMYGTDVSLATRPQLSNL